MNSDHQQLGFAPEEIDQTAATRDVPLKWVVVVDASLPAGRAVNAAVCVAASTSQQVRGLLGDAAVDRDGGTHPGLPWLGCTVLGADTEQLAKVRQRAAARSDLALSDMPAPAQHTRVYADYLAEVERLGADDLSYYALSLVGPRNAVDRLVKGLRLLA